jgi:UDP-N-acetylglucosamine transferase subunit ALG13
MNYTSNAKPIVFVAPLDWGLGHATRCIPIISELLANGCEVIIGAEGTQAHLLKLEFPDVRQVFLKGYHLGFSRSRWMTIVRIIFQIPKILTRIKRETSWLKLFTIENKVDLIISDNRFGLFHASIPTVFITHQLLIKTPFGSKIDNWLRQVNYKFINKFGQCWVPDLKDGGGLAGELSHPGILPGIPVHYLGALSRIKAQNAGTTPIKLLILLSGPEPQRTLLEKQLTKEIHLAGYHIVIIRGLPGRGIEVQKMGAVHFYNHLPSSQLQDIINRSEIIISRPGYSTIMDLLPLGRKCIFIPTPGQSEQEYLAHYLEEKGWCYKFDQNNIHLPEMIKAAQSLALPDFSFFKKELLLSKIITDTLQNLPVCTKNS